MTARLVAIEGEAAGRAATLEPGLYNIGRDPSAQISFPEDDSLADIQAALFRQNGTWFVVDSEIGCVTFVDECAVGRYPAPLKNGSTIRCGRQAFRIEYEEAEEILPIRGTTKKPQVSPQLEFE